ncbi:MULTISPECIES: Na+/H+ antiporter [Gilliamella]|jgi:Na+/H+ antiporter, bacterial form|uniref:Na+/H+ antiporter n=1 Tax=Gilliamella TaxID=1193503 RepID=UPI000A8ED4AF|nr:MULTISPECIES: Na+/H+ antiporter [Gilliamella]MBI0005242.1 Na+/H+ antiporter [Gilliamella sp. W8126]MBI0037664.1 Na+/H+ antiporter [Gilliamella sp. B14384G10]MBI0039659.1 Na+/H+ antiporter [Gilliamella sp. B14384G7]MBI0051499.1 Na+/H+ antiporter [Gilliamella sp. B14384G13]MBI0053951.1 Na+/H+ antiporter [Gilliamella sp. B14384H2]
MELFSTILLLVLIVSLSGVVIKMLPIQIPLPLMQILLGCLLAALGVYLKFDPELFLVLFIPPLLFADGRKTSVKDFVYNFREIVGLALVLVVISIIALGYLLYWMLPNVELPAALALAAVLSPTDAVALSGIVGKGRIEKEKMEIIEGEALMNDASGLVSLKFAIAIAAGALQFNLLQISISFFVVAIGGLAVGVLFTWLYARILRKINQLTHNDPAIQIVLLFLLPFAAYIIAEECHCSGILAAVSAGMTVNQSGMMRNAPLTARLQSDSTWSMLTFVFNGFVFLLLGIQLPSILSTTFTENQTDASIELWQLCLIVLFVFVVLMGTRFAWLWAMKHMPTMPFGTKRPLAFRAYTNRDLWISTFAGVRGAITLAGVLSIPMTIGGRYQLVFIAAGIILVSLISAVIILPILLRGSVILDNSEQDNEILTVKGQMAEEAIVSLEKMQTSLLQETSEEGLDQEIIHEVGSRVIGSLRRRTGLKDLEQKALEAENLERRMRLVAIGAERTALLQMKIRNEVSEETYEHLNTDLDIYEKMISGDA